MHRFLRQRLPDYDYERDFGAVFYVFVRGVQTGWHESDGKATGIFRTRLSHATLQALDQLFVGKSQGRTEAMR